MLSSSAQSPSGRISEHAKSLDITFGTQSKILSLSALSTVALYVYLQAITKRAHSQHFQFLVWRRRCQCGCWAWLNWLFGRYFERKLWTCCWVWLQRLFGYSMPHGKLDIPN